MLMTRYFKEIFQVEFKTSVYGNLRNLLYSLYKQIKNAFTENWSNYFLCL